MLMFYIRLVEYATLLNTPTAIMCNKCCNDQHISRRDRAFSIRIKSIMVIDFTFITLSTTLLYFLRRRRRRHGVGL